MFADDTTKSSDGQEKQKKAKCDYERRFPWGLGVGVGLDPSST